MINDYDWTIKSEKVAKLIVPDWGKKSTMAYGCRTGPPANAACNPMP